MYLNYPHKGFSLLELVLCIGLMCIALPLIWMMISFVSQHMLRLAVQIERDKTVLLLTLYLDRCVATSHVTNYGVSLITTTGNELGCVLSSNPAHGVRVSVNGMIREVSSYQKNIQFRIESDGVVPRQIRVTFFDGLKNLYHYSFYENETF